VILDDTSDAMAIDVLPWLLKGKEREEYDLLNDVDNIDMFSMREVIYVIWYALHWTVTLI